MKDLKRFTPLVSIATALLLAFIFVRLGIFLVSHVIDFLVPYEQYHQSSYSGGSSEIAFQQETEKIRYEAAKKQKLNTAVTIVSIPLALVYILTMYFVWRHAWSINTSFSREFKNGRNHLGGDHGITRKWVIEMKILKIFLLSLTLMAGALWLLFDKASLEPLTNVLIGIIGLLEGIDRLRVNRKVGFVVGVVGVAIFSWGITKAFHLWPNNLETGERYYYYNLYLCAYDYYAKFDTVKCFDPLKKLSSTKNINLHGTAVEGEDVSWLSLFVVLESCSDCKTPKYIELKTATHSNTKCELSVNIDPNKIGKYNQDIFLKYLEAKEDVLIPIDKYINRGIKSFMISPSPAGCNLMINSISIVY